MFHGLDPDDEGPIDWAAVVTYVVDWLLVIGVIVLIGSAMGVDWSKAFTI